MFDPAVLGPTVGFLAALAGDGDALELGIGTGRVAVPLAERGVRVHGIDISEPMIAKLREKPDAASIGATVGDIATTKVDETFRLVYRPAGCHRAREREHQRLQNRRGTKHREAPGHRPNASARAHDRRIYEAMRVPLTVVVLGLGVVTRLRSVDETSACHTAPVRCLACPNVPLESAEGHCRTMHRWSSAVTSSTSSSCARTPRDSDAATATGTGSASQPSRLVTTTKSRSCAKRASRGSRRS
ncbi:MAG: class I SAM-dependent methyltransferase [Actinobacteria bacterium]|nr:class I SAM-dependent methyltransferase [Actinomycetota bacterium]